MNELITLCKLGNLSKIKKLLYEKTFLDSEYLEACCICIEFHAKNKSYNKCVKYIISNGYISEYIEIWISCVYFNNVECMQYLFDRGCTSSYNISMLAALENKIEILNCIHKNEGYWDIRVPFNAIIGKSLECFKYAHTNGCDWDIRVFIGCIVKYNYEFLKYYFYTENNKQNLLDKLIDKNISWIIINESNSMQIMIRNKEINTNLKYTKANIDINWFENIINLDDIEWKSLFELNLTNYPILLKKIKKTLDK